MDAVVYFSNLPSSRTRINQITEDNREPAKKIGRVGLVWVATQQPWPVRPWVGVVYVIYLLLRYLCYSLMDLNKGVDDRGKSLSCNTNT